MIIATLNVMNPLSHPNRGRDVINGHVITGGLIVNPSKWRMYDLVSVTPHYSLLLYLQLGGWMKVSKVLPCSCQHEFQDRVYGNQNRVHTGGKPDSSGTQTFKCTVCSNEKQGKYD